MSMALAERCSRIELLLLDVDGVLTDGQVVFAGADVEVKAFHVRDGSGVAIWRRQGKLAAAISGKNRAALMATRGGVEQFGRPGGCGSGWQSLECQIT